MNTISIGKSLGWAAETFFNQWRLSLKILLCSLAVMLLSVLLATPLMTAALNIITTRDATQPIILPIYASFMFFVHLMIMLIFMTGLINIALALYQHGVSSLRAMFRLPWAVLARVFVIGILYHLMVMIGLASFIVPGIYLAARYYFAMYCAINERMGSVDSFKKAAQLSQGNIVQIIVISFVSYILASTGLLFFMGTLMSVHAYATRLGMQPYKHYNNQ